MKLRMVLGILALGGMMLAPSAGAAVHGVDWVATGVLYGGTSSKVMELKWNGCLGCFFGTYTVTITDPATVTITTKSFLGTIQPVAATIGPFGQTAIITMVGNAGAAGLAYQAQQYASFGNGPHVLSQVVMGSYQGQSFVLATAPYFWQSD